MKAFRTLGQNWPTWLRKLFRIFLWLLLASLFLWVLFYLQGQSTYANPPLIDPDKGKDLAGTATKIIGFVTALIPVYGTMLDYRKKKVELEIEKIKLEQQKQELGKNTPRKAPPRKKKPTK